MFIPRELPGYEKMTPAVAAMLTPMLRIFLIRNGKGNKSKQIEFEFNQYGLGGPNFQTPIERMNNLFKSSFDRGSGAGIKDCQVMFEGTNPATARNDIKVAITLYFASFMDFFRERKETNTDEIYKFVDLILYPSNRAAPEAQNEYNPADYRIRLDVGWNRLSERTKNEMNKVVGASGYGAALDKEIERTNKSFYLNRVGEDIKLNDDGSVEIKIEYRAYIESLLKSPALDALSSPEVYKIKKQRQQKIREATAANCTTVEMNEIKNTLRDQDEVVARKAQQSILKRLVDHNRIYHADLSLMSKTQFEYYGYFLDEPEFTKMGTESAGVVGASADHDKAKADLDAADESKPDFQLLEDDFVDEDIGANKRINFFFLGDLMYILLDSIQFAKEKYGEDEIKFILSSFDYFDFYGSPKIANMAHIPISCHYFFEWFAQNVTSPDPPRIAYPLVYFIRDLCNKFINEILYDVCANKASETRIMFNTAPLFVPNRGGGDPFGRALRSASDPNVVDVNAFTVDATKEYRDAEGILPLYHDLLIGTETKDMYNYMLVYPIVTPFLNPPGRGDESEDRDRGVHHFHIGAPTGLVKNINFTKTDIAYLRESRFMNQGDLGLLQLGAVYRAKIDMIGNTIYYPGMELFINPLGIGGTEFGSPTEGGTKKKGGGYDGKSIANALGFGGYQMVTRVKHQIGPGKFDTEVTTQFTYSGAPNEGGVRLGAATGDIESADSTKAKPGKPKLSAECKSIVNAIRDETALIKGGPTMDGATIEKLDDGTIIKRNRFGGIISETKPSEVTADEAGAETPTDTTVTRDTTSQSETTESSID